MRNTMCVLVHKGRKSRKARATEETAKLVRMVLVICSSLNQTFQKPEVELNGEKRAGERFKNVFNCEFVLCNALDCSFQIDFTVSMASRNVDWAHMIYCRRCLWIEERFILCVPRWCLSLNVIIFQAITNYCSVSNFL